MAKLLKLRRGSSTQHASFTGAEGEVTIDTTKDTAVVHDGSQTGGRPLAREDMTNVSSASIAGRLATDSIAVGKIAAGTLPSDVKIVDANVSGNLTIESADIVDGTIVSGDIADGTIVNADINASAAIAGTKVAPDFGSQNVVTTGTLGSGNLTITSDVPVLAFVDSNDNSDFRFKLNGGTLQLEDTTNSNADRLTIASNGTVGVNGNLDVGAGIDVTGAITVTGTVDGRDVAADGTKLDGIESGATADQTGAEIASALNGQQLYTTGNIGRDGSDHFGFTNNTQVDLYINSNNEFRFEADGDFHADGDVIAQSTSISSDAKLKEDIELVPDALGKLNKLNGVTFTWKRSKEKSAGVIAQDVQKVLPEAVKEVTALSNGETHLSVNYHALTSILIEAVKELKAEVEELKGGK